MSNPVDPQRLAALVEALDQEVRDAIVDVDRSLIHLSLQQSPRDRVRSASNMMRTLTRSRREEPPSGR
jgi:hypothetical protein